MQFKGLNIQSRRSIYTSPISYKDNKLSIFLDYSNKKSIMNRENGIYKVYDNLFLNAGSIPNHHDLNNKMIDKFTLNLTDILEELYDNNKSTVFNLYFLVKPDFDKIIKFDIVKLNQHFAKYPIQFIDQNIVKFYKNTGLLTATGVLVFAPFYDINNLTVISSNIKKTIIKNIEIINKNVNKDFNNTIVNYTNKFDISSEILLIINAEFDRIDPITEKFRNNSVK